MNQSDTERVRTVLGSMGFSETESESEASVLGIIACSVRQKAIDKVYTRIDKWNRMKNRKSLLTFVSGCILPADRDRFLKLFDLVFTMSELPDLPAMISQYGVVTPAGLIHQDIDRQPIAAGAKDASAPIILQSNTKQSINIKGLNLNPAVGINDFWHVEPTYTSDFEAFVPIQNGCDKFCTFCAVPYTRGREVSRPSVEILNEVQGLINRGFKTITLLGQNVNSYGLDRNGSEISFPELLRRIGQLGDSSGKDFWVYFTSPHPRDMTDEVIAVIAQYSVLAKQIHLPLQSGDDTVLLRMNRKHGIDKYRKIVQTIRQLIPQATLFTDIIVGFTGETEEQFMNTMKAFDEFCFNMAYIAQYSVRPGAASSRWDDDIPKEVKKERYQRLTEMLMKHAHQYNKTLIGKTVKVLVRGCDRKPGFLSGYTEGKLVIRFQSDNQALIGQFVYVKINSAAPLSLEGELVPQPVKSLAAL
jgi:tRNA-2-methylthio-N6-dimethylallyladenosine synthase